MTKREKQLYHLDKMILVNIILNYESKLKDMELDDMIEHEKNYLSKPKRSEADEAMARYTKKLFGNKRGKNGKNKVIKGKGKKTAELCKG